mmetsp:Transcript_118106/g.252391  ORF Transcript_118106/g.252391 Transcript_118106/m.252391 type:complete len:621 (+) Transcript_118106:91-1953(+)
MLSMAMIALACLWAIGAYADGVGQCSAGDSSCSLEGADEQTTLLALRRTAAKKGKASKRALTIEGGGWKAQTVEAAFMAGLLNAQARESGGEAVTFESSGLLSSFDTISSNSGGTWFTSSLLFSESFMRMLEEMGAKPAEAGDIYNQEYTAKLLEFAKGGLPGEKGGALETALICKEGVQKLVNLAETAVKDADLTLDLIHSERTKDVLLAMSFFVFPWAALIKNILNSTANISSTMTLGAAPNTFAKGKMWLVCTSVATPGGNLSWAASPDSSITVDKASILFPWKYMDYRAAGDDQDFPLYIPAKYSMILGAGPDAKSPLPFCAEQDCFSLRLKYSMQNAFKMQHAQSPTLAEAFDAAFTSSVGHLPIHQVAATSSDAMAGMTFMPDLSFSYSACQALAVWTSAAPGGQSYDLAQKVIMPNISDAYGNETFFQDIVAAKIQPLMDGQFTDNTAIAHAVAAGATEIVSFLCFPDLMFLFAPSNTIFGSPDALAQMHYKIFEESWQDVWDQMFKGEDTPTGSAFKSLQIPEGNATYLNSIYFGTIKATTAESKWFGVSGGTPVTLHVFYGSIKNGLSGGVDDWYAYGTAITEMTQTMAYPANQALTSEMLAMVTGGSPSY